MAKCMGGCGKDVHSEGVTCAACNVEWMASQPQEGNGEKLQEAAASPGPKAKGARRKKSGEPSAKKAPPSSGEPVSKPKTTRRGSDAASGSSKADKVTKAHLKKLAATSPPPVKKNPKPKKPKRLPAQRASKVGADTVTKLNPNGRKFIGPGGSPRGIRQDGKPRTKPGKNKPKSKETAAFGKKIAKVRAKLGLKQWEVAKKAKLSQPGYANIERGVAGASEDTQKAILKALRVK